MLPTPAKVKGMKPDKRGVLELFERAQRYVIPLYQRRYVWSRQKQWEPLWADVQQRAEAVLGDERQVRPHFLGAVVWSYVRPVGREVPAYEVIDGQQRLTTFQLLLMAFRDVVKDLDPSIYRELLKVTDNDGMREREEEWFKVWPTRFDQPAFRLIKEEADLTKVQEMVDEARRTFQHVPALAAGYLYFAEAIGEWLGAGEATKRADALFQALRRHLQVVTIDLEEDDDPQVIFETLNARGEPLQPADLVRNFIFSDAAKSDEDVPKLFATYWADFDEDNSFWRTQSARGRQLRDQLAWFLSAFLTVKLTEDVSDGAIFEAFKRWWNGRPEHAQPGSAELGLQELRRYAATYQRMSGADGSTRLGLLTRRLEAMEITTLTPVLLYLLTEAQLPEVQLGDLHGDLESYAVRRYVTNLGSKNYNRAFLQLLQDLQKQGVSREVVRAFLSRGSGESVRWPDDHEVRQVLRTSPVYRRLRARGVSMLLEAIDLQLTSGHQERLHLAERLSVEHVLPQSWRSHWPLPETDREETAVQRDQLLHTLGNLTLVTGKLNSGLSNGPYMAKRVALAEQSRLRLNTLFQTQLTWDENVIVLRGEELISQLLSIWGAPDQSLSVTPALQDGPVSNADLQIEAVQQRIGELFPSFFTLEKLDSGFQLLARQWSRSLKFQLYFAEDGDGEGDAFRLGLYNGLPADDSTSADVQRAILRIGERIRLAFSEDQVLADEGAVEIRLSEDTSAKRLTQALIRLLTLSLPEVEKALSLHPRSRRAAGSVLAVVTQLLQQELPEEYFPYSRNVRDAHTFQRMLYSGWDSATEFQILPKSDRVVVSFRSELPQGHPARASMEKLWPELMVLAGQAFPERSVTGTYEPKVAVDVRLPTDASAAVISQTLVRLIAVLHPEIDRTMSAPIFTPDDSGKLL